MARIGVMEVPAAGGTGEAQRVRGSILAAIPLAIVVLGYWLQSQTYLNHDVSWTLVAGNRLIDGAGWGTGVVEPNFPLAWWFAIIPNLIARSFAIDPVVALRIVVTALILYSLWCTDYFLRKDEAPRIKRVAVVSLAAYLLTIAVHRDFGQREHLAVLLLLPYVMAVAHRMAGRTIAWPLALAIGVAAGLGTAIKPFFAVTPVLLELALLWKWRSLRSVTRPEAIGAIAAVTAYGLAILLFGRPWFEHVVPDSLRIYWAFSSPLASHAGYLLMKFSLLTGCALLIVRRRPNPQFIALTLAALGFFGSLLWQSEYFTYHVYPAFTFLALAVAMALPGIRRDAKLIVLALFALAMAQNVNETARTLIDRSASGGLGRHIASVAGFVAAEVPPQGSFTAISTHPYPGFPTALYAGRRWTSASISRLYLPAVVRLRTGQVPADPELLRFAERMAREDMMRDMALRPDVVLIDVGKDRFAIGSAKFDFLAFYLEDPAFAREWSAYRKSDAKLARIDAYVRM